jgi:hypothetical protein
MFQIDSKKTVDVVDQKYLGREKMACSARRNAYSQLFSAMTPEEKQTE